MKHPLPSISTAAVAPALALQGWPVLRLGFRPFYLGAAAFGANSQPIFR